MILCLGLTPTVQRSMTFERVSIDEVNRAVDVKDYASGKSPNVARILRTLGADPLAVGFAGGDRGKFLLDDLAKAGVNTDFVTIPESTRLCTTVIDQSNGAATEWVEEHAAVSPASWAELDRKLRTLLPRSKTWIFSGLLPPGRAAGFLCPIHSTGQRAWRPSDSRRPRRVFEIIARSRSFHRQIKSR